MIGYVHKRISNVLDASTIQFAYYVWTMANMLAINSIWYLTVMTEWLQRIMLRILLLNETDNQSGYQMFGQLACYLLFNIV